MFEVFKKLKYLTSYLFYIMSTVSGHELQYTKHIHCNTELCSELFNNDCVELEFDSYFTNETCSDMKVLDCIVQTCIVPKVCCEIIFEYLPDKFQMSVYSDHSKYYSDTLAKFAEIRIKGCEYVFEYGINYVIETAATGSYLIGPRIYNIHTVCQNIAQNVEYISNHRKLLNNINSVFQPSNKHTVIDIQAFLKIMSCLLMLNDYIPRLKTKPVCIVM